MEKIPPKQKKLRGETKEKLMSIDKNELVERLMQLEAHNTQLKNIISKNITNGSPSGHNSKQKEFDFTKCHFRRVLLRIAYFGWDYQGLAVQEDSAQTIEHHLFTALTKSCLIEKRETSNYHRCGRTDKGVSAFGQVISISLRSKHPPDQQNYEDSLSTEIQYSNTTTTTTLAPPDFEVSKETGICRQCICKDGKVDCFEQNITVFFTKNEWRDLTNYKPTIVDLSENSIVNVTVMAELPIEILNLSRCSIEFIETAAFRDLQQMRVLDLSHNQLTSARLSPHAFEGRYAAEEYEPLASMRTLNLAYNDLHSLNSDLFEHLPELTELDLSGNPLTTIDHVTLIAISSLPMLKTLRLRSCQLSEIPDKFLHTPRYLERLDISNNQLKAVPQELDETKNLVFLNLNQNPIVELDVSSEEYPGFPRLRKLKELHMCNMGSLRRIGAGALAGLENLESLHLSFNPQLSYIHPKALARADEIGENYDWPLLTELYLQSNNLSEVDSRLISRWDLVQKIDVSKNPYLCDCSTQWMVDMLVPIVEAKSVNASEKIVCQEPVEMRGYTMKHLHDIHRTMRCIDKYGNRPEKDGAILLGTLIGVLLAVPIMLSLMLLWRRGYFACIGMRGPVDVSRAFYKRAPHDDNLYM